MVAAGATVLMAASEESPSNGTGNNSTQCENQVVHTNYKEVRRSQQNVEPSSKKDVTPCASNSKNKSRTQMLEKNGRLISRPQNKDSSKNLMLHKTTPIRETKTSRLRAASIISPNSGSALSKRLGMSEALAPMGLQPSTSLSVKEENVSDCGSNINPLRDKSYKRKSYLNRSHNAEATSANRLSQSEYNDRRAKRQSTKPGHISETISTTESSTRRQATTNLHKKHLEPKMAHQRVSTQYVTNHSKTCTSTSISPLASVKYSNIQRNSGGHSDSEVSRRVDALTALTKATMERVERLASHSNLSANHGSRSENHNVNISSIGNSYNNSNSATSTTHTLQSSPRKYSILKKSSEEHPQDGCSNYQPTPVSILKHKVPDSETGQSPNSTHATLPVTFSPCVVEPVHKRHGILKKRSSLDESEILHRRSCSPDVSFTDTNYPEFRPILKNQRRSSLDEIIKRDQSPDPQPTSILKRKSSKEDDKEDRLVGSSEPQSILKRKSTNNIRTNNINHHVTITSDATSICNTEIIDSSEVKPILKKKHSREESSGNELSSIEPRPILKKKSSTESDDHDDKPKKTILKCARKNSQDECNYEGEITSPKKLSVLKNRTLQSRTGGLFENDPVRPILKQSVCRENESRVRINLCDDNIDACVQSADLFLRKRAQSLGHVQPSCSSSEFSGVLNKRRSLELTCMNDLLQEKLQSRLTSASTYLKPDYLQSGESTSTTSMCDVPNRYDIGTKERFTDKGCKDKKSITVPETEKENRIEPYTLSLNNNIGKLATQSSKMSDTKDSTADTVSSLKKNNDEMDIQNTNGLHHSKSVSKMTLHFKALQEKANSNEKDNVSQRTLGKASRGIQRYRDRKLQGNDRFNTQPVTFQEVQDAVLQNQRNAASNECKNGQTTEENVATDDEFDPSKLSLADRVRLFNQKIATEETSVSSKVPQEKHARRRPATRYKTQPITSEEVEVASRISPLNSVQHLEMDRAGSEECQDRVDSSTSLGDLPKSILKPGNPYVHTSRLKSPELEGIKLIKSVLKKESEELEQQVSENCNAFPRSILKTNLNAKSGESNLYHTTREIKDENSIAKNKNSNIDVKLHKQMGGAMENNHATDYHSHCALDVGKNNISEDMQKETKLTQTVPFNKNITQDESSCTRTKFTVDDTDNAQAGTLLSDDDTSSSGGREVHSIIKREVTNNRRHAIFSKQTKYSALSKSASHHALSNETHDTESFGVRQHGIPLPGLCRSATQAIPTIEVNEGPSMSIADRLAALQRNGNTNWKRRLAADTTNLSDMPSIQSPNKEELKIKQGVLADCLGKLESATEGWKKRIAASDVTKFTVAGKMKVEQHEILESGPPPLIAITGSSADRKKRTPRPERFRARKGSAKDATSTPTSPNKDISVTLRRSYSEPASDDSGEEHKIEHSLSPTVSVPKTDDETFTAFFTGISVEKCEAEAIELHESDFDIITSQSELLVQKRNIRIQRRRVASKNPIKALAARTDLKSEYTEIRTGVAEKVMRELNIEKLAKNSPLAIEALAGLASTEDFSTVMLRNAAETSVSTNKLQPYKELMLLLIKGRRHVQVRLVEPAAESINSGDNFILVTKTEVYNYIGKYSNVIEKARAAEIALSIQQNKDLGCQATQVITIHEDKISCTKSQLQKFWNYLGIESDAVNAVIDSGHPDEDELYESAVIDTNMVYELKNEELVPLEKYWGAIPKIEMLDPNKVLVFDFGTEMYIWSGKGASSEKKRIVTHLATEMWKEGYDYRDCAVCPISAACMIGRRTQCKTDIKFAKDRPKWCLLAKLTQHVETVLFREKFLDWPNMSGIIRVRGTNDKEQVDGTITIEPCNIDTMLEQNTTPVDLILEGSHLGRGTGSYDDELMKQSVVTTASVTMWHIDEFSYTLLDQSSIGQFYTGDSYIIRWMYSITITGRELSGMPSKYSAKGRDRSVYFIWQGKNASLNEQGAAALLTVELDNDQAPQIRVVQGHEPAAFLNLFSGGMIVHNGKKTDIVRDRRWRLYICRGTLESEVSLTEIPCSTRQLRSRGSLILLDTECEKMYVWHGSNTLQHIRKNAFSAAMTLKDKRPQEAGLSPNGSVKIVEVDEGDESQEFFSALGGMNKQLYVSLEKEQIQDHTPRLFHLSSISKEFKSVEILCPHRAELSTPFPFLQEELYQVSQPALFLMDNKIELWIWQGWWPDTGAEDQSGSKAVRWQAERRAAMAMAMDYWRRKHPETTKFPIYLVWAGIEPLRFINLFPMWTYRDDIAELNIEDGRNPGEVLNVESELARLTQSTYPPAQLLQRPLPEGVDPTRLELYLSRQHFEELLGITKEEFQELPVWKQVNLKKEIGLF